MTQYTYYETSPSVSGADGQDAQTPGRERLVHPQLSPPATPLPPYVVYQPSRPQLAIPQEKQSYPSRQPSPAPSTSGYAPSYTRPVMQSGDRQDSGYASLRGDSVAPRYAPPPGMPPGRMDSYSSLGSLPSPMQNTSSSGYASPVTAPSGYASPVAGPSSVPQVPSSLPGSQPDTPHDQKPQGSTSGMSGAISKATALVKKFAPGESVEALVNPPPPGFLRMPPSLQYPPFEATALIGASKTKLDAGFPPILPPSTDYPHPFITHDVMEEDWVRFVGDLKKAAGLAIMDRVVSNALPMVKIGRAHV